MIEADTLSRSNSLKSVEDIHPTANDTQSPQQSKCFKKSFGKSTLSSFRRTASLRICSASRRLKSNFSIRSSKTNQKDALSPKWHNGLAKANSMRSHLVPSHSFTASGRPSIDASLSINSMDSHNLHSSTSSSSRANSFRSLEHTLMSSEDDIKPLQVSSRFKRLRRSLSTKIRRSGRNVLRRTTSFVVRRKTISSDALLHEHDNQANSASFPTDSLRPSSEYRVPGSISSNSSADKKLDEEAPFLSKKKKYFTERNRNIFRKLLHPSYQERNVQYRRLFGHLVSDTDLFLISFSCAYQREILCQGRMYISQRHICFHANIFGWETCFAVPFDEITNMTKEKAALIFPNSIQFETKGGEKHFFASFGNREKTVTALSMVLERREKNQDIAPEEVWERLNSDKRYRGSKSNISSPVSPMTTTSSPIPPFASSQPTSPVREVEAVVLDEEEVNCLCDGHYGKVLLDQTFPLSVLELRELVFNNSDWFSQFNKVLKNSDYHSSDWAVDKDGQLNRTCTYTMALNHAMAPKSCIVNENQIIRNLSGSDASQGFVVNKETQNSGVPYAENFTVRCTYCVMRVSRTSSRLLIHGGIFYIKNIWALVKGYIEKTAYQGLEDHYAMLKKMLGEECQRRLSEGPNTNTVEDSSENESLSSSVEDPTTDSPTKQRFMNSVEKSHKNEYTHVPKDILENTRPAVKDSVITLDYTWHIRIIIGLLAGLVFIQLLVLVRMNTIGTEYSDLRLEMSKSHPTSMERMASSPSESSSNVIESLVDTVNRLTADVQRLKERQEL